MKRILSTILLTIVSTIAFAQDGHITYTDVSNPKSYGRDVLVRTDHANLDTLTSVYAGSFAYDTLNNVLVYYDGTSWVDVVSGGGTLDAAYDYSGAGLGRTITSDAGAVEIIAANTDSALNVEGYSSLSNTDVNDNALFFGIQPDDEPLTYFAVYQGDDGTLTGIKLDKDGPQQLYNGASGNVAHGGALSDGFKIGASGASTWGKFWIEYDQPTLVRNELISDPLQNSEIRTYYDHVEIDALNTEIQGSLEVVTTTGAFTPPILTTTERNALTPTSGMMIYNSTTSKHQGYDGTIWNDLY